MALAAQDHCDVVVVYKKSKLDLYVYENQNPRYRELVRRNDSSVRRFVAAHDAHHRALENVLNVLESQGLSYRLAYRANFRNEGDVVITVGGDGTLLDASRRVTHARVLGVNSDPAHSGGFLCAGRESNMPWLVHDVIEDRAPMISLRRIGGAIDGVPLHRHVLNDILIAQLNPAATVKYELIFGGRQIRQKSSGVWVSTATGSTAGIRSAGGEIQHLDDKRLQFWVRELYLAEHDERFQRGYVAATNVFTIKSQMREGRIFLDGPHTRLPFVVGSTLTLHGDAPPLRLVVTDEMRARRGLRVRGYSPASGL